MVHIFELEPLDEAAKKKEETKKENGKRKAEDATENQKSPRKKTKTESKVRFFIQKN